jgi:hypothetical protein
MVSAASDPASRLEYCRSADDSQPTATPPPKRDQNSSESMTARYPNSKFPLTRFRPNPVHSIRSAPGCSMSHRIGWGQPRWVYRIGCLLLTERGVSVFPAGQRATNPAKHKPHRARHPYALRGCVWCGLCGRRMQGHWVHGDPYYRCQFASAAQQDETIRARDDEESARKIAEGNRKLTQYRAALDAGANPATVAGWIAETEAERSSDELARRQTTTRTRMSEAEIRAIVDKLADIARVLTDADPDDKAEIFRQLGLKLTYHPGRRIVDAEIEPAPRGFFDGVRGPSAPKNPRLLATKFTLDAAAR